jgi:hypothetical protein
VSFNTTVGGCRVCSIHQQKVIDLLKTFKRFIHFFCFPKNIVAPFKPAEN